MSASDAVARFSSGKLHTLGTKQLAAWAYHRYKMSVICYDGLLCPGPFDSPQTVGVPVPWGKPRAIRPRCGYAFAGIVSDPLKLPL